ncbi:hypothetical protein H704_01022 [Bartonella bacilliformis Peru38]|uniref:hypothetical protein n=1 Tax=Bartonella bacilliformis TaxID=774 RepID=UPI0004478195|nr:hypothetical protein [Bartonella bacilliformis]EYS94393.1 hypothetical protein X470_01097 [Bartonella bacilliformis Peru-18]KEG15880.1 hypothetical protein H709_00996 [Bartonella bacilliformis CUSCO5]KEG19783.1 hypothetical protein H704_01022 [Bartonella bacilliformis Peru38]KEG22187.1 hypothetical protein H703_01012 [Bartonella bacilliformis Ver075]KZM37493.1 hypothetical protein AWH67_04960 [Bartonella bacilliformis]
MEINLRFDGISDDVTYGSMRSMIKYEIGTVVSVLDVLQLSREQVNTARIIIDIIRDLLAEIQKSIVYPYEKGSADIAKMQETIAKNVKKISHIIRASILKKSNILTNGGIKIRLPSSYNRSEGFSDIIEIGGPEFNFGVVNANGTIDISQGVLTPIFETGTTENFSIAREIFETAYQDFKKLEDALIKAKAYYVADPSLTNETIYNNAQKAVDESTRDNGAWSQAKAQFKVITDNISMTDFVTIQGIASLSFEAQMILFNSFQKNVQYLIIAILITEKKINFAIALIDTQPACVKLLIQTLNSDTQALIDTNCDAASIRLSILEIRKQLSLQRLPIANHNSQSMMTFLHR